MGVVRCGSHGVVCCDGCDECPKCSGRASKRSPCPVGWCGPYRFCPDCYARHAGKLHAGCKAASDHYAAERAARDAATAAGLPVVRAGVGLPGGAVFAWLTNGDRYEVAGEVYAAAIARADHVLNLEGARKRLDEHPPEVYGPKGTAPRYADEATPDEARAILSEMHRVLSEPAPPEPLPFSLQAPPAPRRRVSQGGLF